MSKTYWEKLQDPRWQRRKSEMQHKADFACQSCGGKDQTIHVHHRIYRPKTEPWDYPDEELEVLCKTCHTAAEEERQHVNETMAQHCFERLIVLVAKGANYEDGEVFGDRYAKALHELKCLLITTESMEWLLRDLRALKSIPRWRYDALMSCQQHHRDHMEACIAALRKAVTDYHAEEMAALEGKPIIENKE